jgi:hypothetical protein
MIEPFWCVPAMSPSLSPSPKLQILPAAVTTQ